MRLTPEGILDENYCVCILQNAWTVFVFWKFSQYYLRLFKDNILLPEIRLKVYDADERCLVDIPVRYSLGGYHITLPRFTPRIKVGLFCIENGVERRLCVSDELILPFEKELKKDYNFYYEKG